MSLSAWGLQIAPVRRILGSDALQTFGASRRNLLRLLEGRPQHTAERLLLEETCPTSRFPLVNRLAAETGEKTGHRSLDPATR